MGIDDAPGSKNSDFKVLDVALCYKVVVPLCTGWGGGSIFYLGFSMLPTSAREGLRACSQRGVSCCFHPLTAETGSSRCLNVSR